MNIQVLPNWFKKVSLIVFLSASVLASGDDFINGFNAGFSGATPNYDLSKVEGTSQIADSIGGEGIAHLFGALSVLALIMYMLSKEKVEDDYINMLRLESFQFSFMLVSFVALALFAFNKEFYYGLYDSLCMLLWIYLIVFFTKKRFAL